MASRNKLKKAKNSFNSCALKSGFKKMKRICFFNSCDRLRLKRELNNILKSNNLIN